jgi:hypothetical protein
MRISSFKQSSMRTLLINAASLPNKISFMPFEKTSATSGIFHGIFSGHWIGENTILFS